MAEPSSRQLLRRASTLKIVKQEEVSPAEENFHELENGGETEVGGDSPGAIPQDGHKSQGWEKISKSIDLSAVLNAAAPPLEEGGTLDLSTEDFRQGIPYRFKVHLEQLPGKTLVVTCDPTDGAAVKISTHEKEGIVTYMCTLVPLKQGEFTISTLFGKKHVLGSPFKVKFDSPADASLCSLNEAPEACRTSVDANTLTFCVYTNQEREGLLTASAKSLTSKASVPVTISQSGKSHYDVEFDANDGKKYRLTIKFDNQPINGSPFLLHLSDASVCTATGDGIVRGVVGQENHFDVSTKGAGPGKLKVKVEGKSQAVVIIKPKEDDVYDVTYFPKKVGSYQITVLWLEEEIPGSPFLIQCYKPVGVTLPKPEKSSVYMVGELYKIKIDAKESGEGTLEASSVEEGGADVNVTSPGKGQYRVEVSPKTVGTLHVRITWGGVDVPGSPFPMEVDCKPDANQIVVSSPVYGVGSLKPVVLELNTEKAGAGKLKAKCIGEKSKSVAVTVSEGPSKIREVTFEPTKPDIYTLWVTWSKTQVPGSPFTINLHPSDSTSCQLIGAPIAPEDWQEPALLNINTLGAGNGKLEVKAEGESSGAVEGEHLKMREKDGGEMEISLVAPAPDIYKVYVSWGGEEIPKSPFVLNRITPDAEKCSVSISRFGPAWDNDIILFVDAATAGNGQLVALAVGKTAGDVSNCISVTPDEKEYGKFEVKFSPDQPDVYTFTLEWSGKVIPGFPCQLNRMPYAPDRVTVFEQPQGIMNVGQDIAIGVDTSSGGPGKLTATCSAMKGGDIPVEIKTRQDEYKFRVSFTPSDEDIYTLSVFLSGQHMSGSPFKINLIPVDASKVTASEPMFPQGPQGPCEVLLGTENAGNAEITALCMGNKSGRVPVTVKSVGENQHKLSFTPPHPDFFTMGVKYGDKKITRSPFYVNTHPPNAKMVTVTPPETTSLRQTIQFAFNGSNAGFGELKATAFGDTCGNINVITDIDIVNSQYIVKFFPVDPDIYRVCVKWGEEEVPGSPFIINLLPLDASLVEAKTIHFSDEAGSEYAYVTVDCSKVGVLPLVTSVLGDETGHIDSEIEELPNACQNVKFVPPRDDKYSISILFNDEDIPGSPFVMNIVSPQPEKVKLISTSIPNQLLPLVVLTFNTSEAGRGKMEASTRGLKSGEVNNHEISESVPGTWRVSFIPPFPDTYNISCLWARREIPHSPFQVNLESAVASEVAVGEIHIPAQAGTGEEVWLDLDCTTAGHDVVRGTFEDASSRTNSQEAEVVILGLKRYRLKVVPKEPGLYSFSVRYGRDHVQGSPFEVDLQLCLPEGVKVKERNFPQYSDGKQGYIVVDTNEAGRGRLTAKLNTKGKHDNIPLTFQEIGGKLHKILFTPPSPDSYSLEIFWSDNPVPSSRQHFTVLLPIRPERVRCGELVGYGPGQLAKLDVSTLGAGQAPLTATCKAERCGAVDVNVETLKTDPDSHIVYFNPPTEDKYSLRVCYHGTEVPGSPFSLDLMLDPLKCFILDDSDLRLPIHIDQEVRFSVDTTNGGHGQLRVSVIAPGGKPTTTYLIVSQPESGLYHVSFTPTTKGLHQINLEWGPGFVRGSPIQLDVHEPAVPIYHNGKPVTIQLKRMYAALSEVSALAAHVGSDTHCHVTISHVTKGEFMLAFEAKEPGMYRVNIHKNNQEIKGSPYYIRYAPPADPNACILTAPATCTHIGEMVDFHLNASEAGFGEIAVLPDIPLSGMESTVNIRDNRNGTYIIQYTPQAIGRHSIHVNWAGKPVPGSPLSLQVSRLENSEGLACLAEGQEMVFQEPHATDTPLQFVIKTPDGGTGKLSVSSHGPAKPDLVVKDNKDHSFTCELSSSEPGNYWIHVLWKRKHIEGSPFLLTLVPKKVTKLLGLNTDADSKHLSTILIKEEDECIFNGPQPVGSGVSFRLVTGDAGRGELSISCTGPGNAEIDIYDNGDGSHSCTLKVTEQGEYKVYILWEKIHISGSPFSVSFLPPKAVQILGLNPCSSPGFASNITIAEEDRELLTNPQPVGPLELNIVTSKGGKGELCVSGVGLDDISVEMVETEKEGVQTCRLVPACGGEYRVSVLWNKIHIPGSPFDVVFTNEKARSVLGIGLSRRSLASNTLARVHVLLADMEQFEKKWKLDSCVHFRVSTKRAGKGVLTLSTQGPGKPKVKIVEVKNNICVCKFSASIAGKYKIFLLWNNEKVDDIPLELTFESTQRQVTGIDLKDVVLPLNQPHKFKVFHDAGLGEGELDILCRPSNAVKIEIPVAEDTYYQCEFTPLVPGNHDLVILYNDREILGSPFPVHFHSDMLDPLILPTPPIPHNIRVSGPGINSGIINQEGNFVVDTTTAGLAKLDFEVQGPYGGFNAQLRQHWENQKVLLARYDPTLPGRYRLAMTWAGIEIPGSPFEVNIQPQT